LLQSGRDHPAVQSQGGHEIDSATDRGGDRPRRPGVPGSIEGRAAHRPNHEPEISASALKHGHDLLRQGFTVSQVVALIRFRGHLSKREYDVPTDGRQHRRSAELTTTEESRLHLVGAAFDAGIHLGEFVERDMVAVRVSGEQRAAIVAEPSYFASHPKPKSPRDPPGHRCINFRHGSAGVYHWEFDKGRKSLSVAVNGPLTVDDVDV
jgi:hypothetical protein